MAKKRRRKKKTGLPNFKFSVEVTGLIFALLGIIGLFNFGVIGLWIKTFSVILFGKFYVLLIILIILLGLYMLLQRELPAFFTRRMIGLYFILISLLSFFHMNVVNNKLDLVSSIDETWNNCLAVKANAFVGLSSTGGGIVGNTFSWIFTKLFAVNGSYLVIAIILLFGLILISGLSFTEFLDKVQAANAVKKEEKKKKKAEEKKKEEEEESFERDHPFIMPEMDEDEDEDKDKVVITSAEEMKKFHAENVEVEPEPGSMTALDLMDKNAQEKPVENVPTININSTYKLPLLDDVLDPIKKNKKQNTDEFIKSTTIQLESVLADFQIVGKVEAVHEGPTVTQFEVRIKNGTKVSRITGISKEIALSLAAKDVRIEAPIPGKTTVGIEIPNKEALSVPIREVLQGKLNEMSKMKLPVSLGKDIMGNLMITDLAKTPHLLVAGSTGSGKSVCVNSFINSLLITKRPDEVKLVLVDPKKVELSNYNGIPHLLCPVVTDPKKASIALQNIVKMMEDRYDMFADEKVKNISGYNDKMDEELKRNPGNTTIKKMPYILVIIDELADLMLVASKEVEDSIMRITQMARAAGIHLIVATQRPSTDVITGVVKANIPSRISFAVASQIDSRTILDSSGAEKLLGKGDMLFKPMGENNGVRIQGNFISDDEIERVIKYVCKEQVAQYDESITMAPASSSSSGEAGDLHNDASEVDALYDEVVDFAIESGKISASLIQRRFKVGYNRAARLVDELEARGIVGPQNGSKPREVLVKLEQAPTDQE